MKAPSGTLRNARATGTSYGEEVPRRFLMLIVAASAPPSRPSRPTTRMSPGLSATTFSPVGQLSRRAVGSPPLAGKHRGRMDGLPQTAIMVMPTRTATNIASTSTMLRKLRSRSCWRSIAS